MGTKGGGRRAGGQTHNSSRRKATRTIESNVRFILPSRRTRRKQGSPARSQRLAARSCQVSCCRGSRPSKTEQLQTASASHRPQCLRGGGGQPPPAWLRPRCQAAVRLSQPLPSCRGLAGAGGPTGAHSGGCWRASVPWRPVPPVPLPRWPECPGDTAAGFPLVGDLRERGSRGRRCRLLQWILGHDKPSLLLYAIGVAGQPRYQVGGNDMVCGHHKAAIVEVILEGDDHRSTSHVPISRGSGYE